MASRQNVSLAIFAAVLAVALPSIAHSSDASWHVGRSSGSVWVTKSTSQTVSLTNGAVLDAGDSITTGSNGRVLLLRGEERIMVSPNSAIGIPTQNADGMRTTIMQRAGSILLDVEKKNVQHFEVETPYLAAVVKGTQFRVTVNGRSAKVDVTRGQVQVADFKSGQMAMLLPGQTAKVFSRGSAGLSLSGNGKLNPIERAAPRIPSVQALSVPKAGLRPPSVGEKAKEGSAQRKQAASDAASRAFAKQISGSHKGGLRINAPIGEVKLDFHKVTKGLAHGAGDAAVSGGDRKGSVFSESPNKGLGQVDATGKSTGSGNGGGTSSVAASSSGSSSSSAASGGSIASATGNGNGNGGGNSGGNGNNGNGNGNNDDNGNGKSKGKGKKDK